jgi:parallel beta-helix repeat protein
LDRGSATYHGTSKLRQLRRAIPDPLKVVSFPCDFPANVRGIRLEPNTITLVAGGKAIRTIAFPHAGQTVTLPQIVQAIDDPSWISLNSAGVVQLDTSLIQESGTSISVAAPVTALHIVDNHDVSFSGSGARVNFQGVTVSSWDPKTNSPVTTAKYGRPFVLFENNSTMNISNCTFSYLGSDVTSSYGVSWRVGHTDGVVNHSLFEHNFFGVYTYDADGVLFENSTYRDNVYYGLDPHTYSSHITIRNNNVYDNGDHGIVFSRYVTDSLVENNYVHNNRVNGIMMDYRSDHNVIRDNTVRDNAEGIVFSGSADNVAYGNIVSDNVVGVRGSHVDATGDDVHNNVITGGRLGVQLYGGAADFTVANNTITGPSRAGMEIQAAGTVLSGNVIARTPIGIKVQSVTSIEGGRVASHKAGIVVADQGFANISGVQVSGLRPLTILGRGFAQLTSTTFGLPGSRNTISVLDIVAIGILAFALGCEILHAARHWRLRRLQQAWVSPATGAANGVVLYAAPEVRRRQLLVLRPPRVGDASRRSTTSTKEAPDTPPSGLRKFRPDVEGLRAIAVVAVILSHASLGLPGGYVGVDVFFVISGFLITRQLVDEHRVRGRISFGGFYARRARRILPAATLVTVATLIMTWRWASPLQVASIAKDAVAAALFSVNWRLAAQGTNYFNASSAPSPFQHYWSLSVEEQFYVVWPMLLVIVALLFAKRFGVTKPLLVVLTAVVAASLWESIHLTPLNSSYAYFGTHTRAWELAVGALIAVGARSLPRIPRPLAAGIGWAGCGAILAACFLYTSNTAYPGSAALLPVLGAAAVIVAGCGAAARFGPEHVLLRRKLFQGTGRISYSLYLWHWPLLILVPDMLGHSLSLRQRLTVVAIAVGLSVVTFIFLEEPIRRQQKLVSQPVRAALMGAGLISISVLVALQIGSAVPVPGGNQPVSSAPEDFSINQLLSGPTAQTGAGLTAQLVAASQLTSLPANVTPTLAQAPNSFPNTQGCEVSEAATAPLLPCNSFGDVHSKTQVVLIGDSHAGMWFDGINQVALERHWRLAVFTKSGCSVGDYPGLENLSHTGPYTQCTAWRPKMIAAVKALHPSLIIIGSEARPIASTESEGLISSIDALKVSGAKIAFLADVPSAETVGSVPDCLAKHLHNITACDIARSKAGLNSPGRLAEIQAAESAGATVINPAVWMCTSSVCPVVVQGVIVYLDGGHITGEFGLLRAPQLGAALSQAMSS